MKKVFLFIGLLYFAANLLGVCASSCTGAPKNNLPSDDVSIDTPVGYTLVWGDDFNGVSLNSSDWNIEVNGDGGFNNELQYYRANNVSIGQEPVTGKNCLILTARKESYGGMPATSGRVNTMGKRFFRFGRIDASIKMPHTANGLWPAFWAMGNDNPSVSWPRCGEIDVVEMGSSGGFNDLQDRYFNGACHWGPEAPAVSYAHSVVNSYGVQDDFHLYTLVWDEQSVKTFLDLDKYPDAHPYFEMDISDSDGERSPGRYFQKEFFILLNLAVGGDFPAIWDINGISAFNGGNAQMYIDYVKVYKSNL
jgi:beta-glucanase (GH16 family)